MRVLDGKVILIKLILMVYISPPPPSPLSRPSPPLPSPPPSAQVMADGRFRTATGEILGVADDASSIDGSAAMAALAAGGGLAAIRGMAGGGLGGGGGAGGAAALRQVPLLERELKTVRWGGKGGGDIYLGCGYCVYYENDCSDETVIDV